MFTIDKKLERLGFSKDYENSLIVSYSRFNKDLTYCQVVEIIYKKFGNHCMMSYSKRDLLDYEDGLVFSNAVVGLTYRETKLFLQKFKQMKRKYGWE